MRPNSGYFSEFTGNSLTSNNDTSFSTMDQDNDRSDTENCAQKYKGGWWFEDCHHFLHSGLYIYKVILGSGRGNGYSYKYTELKIRQNEI